MDYLRGLITLESLVVLCLVSSILENEKAIPILTIATKVINYIHVLSNFHSSRQPPDVLRGELWDRGVSYLSICPFNLSSFRN